MVGAVGFGIYKYISDNGLLKGFANAFNKCDEVEELEDLELVKTVDEVQTEEAISEGLISSIAEEESMEHQRKLEALKEQFTEKFAFLETQRTELQEIDTEIDLRQDKLDVLKGSLGQHDAEIFQAEKEKEDAWDNITLQQDEYDQMYDTQMKPLLEEIREIENYFGTHDAGYWFWHPFEKSNRTKDLEALRKKKTELEMQLNNENRDIFNANQDYNFALNELDREKTEKADYISESINPIENEIFALQDTKGNLQAAYHVLEQQLDEIKQQMGAYE